MKILGLIVIDHKKNVVTDRYGNVPMFKTPKAALPYMPFGGRMRRVVMAKVTRKTKPKKGPS